LAIVMRMLGLRAAAPRLFSSVRRALSLLLLRALLSVGLGIAPVATSAHASVDGAELNLVVLEARLDGRVIGDALIGYEAGSDVLLPLGELARLLSLGISVDAATSVASGFVLQEHRSFRVDTERGRYYVHGRRGEFEPSLVRWIDGDLHVPSQWLAQWLPLDLRVDLNALQLVIVPREILPVQARHRRETEAGRLGARGVVGRDELPFVRQPHRVYSRPNVDLSLGGDTRLGGTQEGLTNWAGSAHATGDLARMAASLFLASTNGTSGPDARLSLARHDPDARLLGPMRARSLVLGSVTVPGQANVLRGGGVGNGLEVGNRPLGQSATFGQTTLRGELLPGWDVTLYYNEALVGFQQSQPDGLYVFADLPLLYGLNEFRLVFNGPLGQTRVERQAFLLDQSLVRPGEFQYALAAQRLESGGSRGTAQFDVGLRPGLAGTVGIVAIDHEQRGSASQAYANAGLRASAARVLMSLDHVRAGDDADLWEVGVHTQIGRHSARVTQTLVSAGFVSDFFPASSDPVRTRTQLRLNGSLPFSSGPAMPVAFDAAQDRLDSGNEVRSATLRVSTNVRGTSMSNSASYNSGGAGTGSRSGALQLSRRVAGVGLSSQVAYILRPDTELSSFAVAADRSFGPALRANIGMLHSLRGSATTYTAGLTRNFNSYGLSFTARHSQADGTSLGLQLFAAVGHDPLGGWRGDWQALAATGSVATRAFLDVDGDGRYGPGDEPIPNAGFLLNAASRAAARTNEQGIAHVGRLPPNQYVDIALDAATLEDAQWTPVTPGARVLPRAGSAQVLEFPVALTSEVDGTVYLDEGSGARGIGNALVELLDGSGHIHHQAYSSSDGYYVVTGVRPGRYLARIAPRQQESLGLRTEQDRWIDVPANGDYVDGIDFVLQRSN
jgi:hypothetical protein